MSNEDTIDQVEITGYWDRCLTREEMEVLYRGEGDEYEALMTEGRRNLEVMTEEPPPPPPVE